MHFPVGRDECILFQGSECPQQFPGTKIHVTIVNLPHTMIKPDAVGAPIAKQVRIACAVLRILHIPVAVHLKPVNVFLFWQT